MSETDSLVSRRGRYIKLNDSRLNITEQLLFYKHIIKGSYECHER